MKCRFFLLVLSARNNPQLTEHWLSSAKLLSSRAEKASHSATIEVFTQPEPLMTDSAVFTLIGDVLTPFSYIVAEIKMRDF